MVRPEGTTKTDHDVVVATSPTNNDGHGLGLTSRSRRNSSHGPALMVSIWSGQRPAAWWGFEVDSRCQSPLLSSAMSSVSSVGPTIPTRNMHRQTSYTNRLTVPFAARVWACEGIC